MVVGDLNNPFSIMAKTTRQKMNTEIEDLNYTITQLNLIETNRTPHTTTAKYTFFSSGHGRLSRLDRMLGHKANLNKFKRIETIQRMFSNHNGMKIEINNKGIWEVYRYVAIKPDTAK